jgi:hypothetical protein
MFDAIRWLSLGRPDLTPVLDRLETPTMLSTNADDPMWTIAAARAAASHLRNGTLAIFPGSGHIGPLLQAAPDVVDLLTAFWRDPHAAIARQRVLRSARPVRLRPDAAQGQQTFLDVVGYRVDTAV